MASRLSLKIGILIIFQYLKRHKRGIFVYVGLVIILAAAQIKFNLFFDPNTIRIGIIGTYQEHDLPEEVTRLLSSSLVEPDSKGEMVGKMIKGWETSSDATSFKFKLKDELRWVDNTKILAHELSFNIPDVEIDVSDNSTIQFKLKDSYSPFPSLLTKPVFKKGTLLGTGPFYITKIEKSKIFITKITLEPARPAGGSKNRNLPKIFIRFYPNEKVAQTGFNLGEVQILMGTVNPKEVSQNPKVKLLQKNDFGKIVTILYNALDPLLSHRSLRQALSFQAPEIEDLEVANNPYPKNFWAYDPESKRYLNNPEEAASALERATQALNEEKLKGDLILTATPNLEEVAKKVVAAWEEMGFKIKIRTESGIPQNFQILLITQSIPSDPDQYFLWHSTQEKTNLSKYQSARVDKDLEDGRKTANIEDRKNKYFDFQKTLLEDAPATFLYFPKYNIVYLKKVEANLNKLLPLQFPNP